MKVENKGVVITDFPGPIDKLIVQKANGQVMVTIVPIESYPEVDLTTEQMEQFAEAVQEALKQAREMAGVSTDSNGSWNHLNDVPAHITAVWDKVNDPVYRDGDGWSGVSNLDDYSSDWGPFRAER